MMAVAVSRPSREELALDAAAEAVARGWTQGAYYRTHSGKAPDEPGPNVKRVDLAWALRAAAELHGCDSERLRELVRLCLPEPYSSDTSVGIERWNDQPYRTRTEVLYLLARVRDGLL